MNKAIFYHAGCPVCVSAEQDIIKFGDKSNYDIEVVHLGNAPERISEAERLGAKSVPVLVLNNGNVLHINFGASLQDLKSN